MAKIDYTKVENALRDSINKMFIQQLHELAAIATLMDSERASQVSMEEVTRLTSQFQSELKRIRKDDPDFYVNLGLSAEQEKKFNAKSSKLTKEDWAFLKDLSAKIENWKKTLKIREPKAEDIDRIEAIRKKQKDARFNVNPKWKPL